MSRNDTAKTTTGAKIAAGLVAVALLGVLISGLVTGDLSHGRYIYFKRSSDPLFFWTYIGLFAVGAGYAALFAAGHIKLPSQADYVAHVRRPTVFVVAVHTPSTAAALAARRVARVQWRARPVHAVQAAAVLLVVEE